MIMPNVVPRPHASGISVEPSYLGDFDLKVKRRHKNECYLVSASRTYLERSFGPHNSAGVRVGYKRAVVRSLRGDFRISRGFLWIMVNLKGRRRTLGIAPEVSQES
jgi:hypothetical protein